MTAACLLYPGPAHPARTIEGNDLGREVKGERKNLYPVRRPAPTRLRWGLYDLPASAG